MIDWWILLQFYFTSETVLTIPKKKSWKLPILHYGSAVKWTYLNLKFEVHHHGWYAIMRFLLVILDICYFVYYLFNRCNYCLLVYFCALIKTGIIQDSFLTGTWRLSESHDAMRLKFSIISVVQWMNNILLYCLWKGLDRTLKTHFTLMCTPHLPKSFCDLQTRSLCIFY